MKIKITQAGWEGFTGHFGPVEFQDGISVYDVSKSEAQMVAALVTTENEEGGDPSVAQQILDMQGIPAPVEAPVVVAEAPQEPAVRYSFDELAQIADKQGIKGLRAIADPMGLKDNSITDLIGKILAVAGKKPEEQPAEAVE